ncbi:hypothetical protein K488DRAFT_68151 [Vararia minispora EC-137]|uniref:Uncharacterized protein n=1 Tax=Vararia minispora EC-137 TaxID=1314806 RepID=A0ACB8QWB3_9AGAM|nr:hypothetical protein K488DRAFT_68151 [Vararia minispora EC-137]
MLFDASSLDPYNLYRDDQAVSSPPQMMQSDVEDSSSGDDQPPSCPTLSSSVTSPAGSTDPATPPRCADSLSDDLVAAIVRRSSRLPSWSHRRITPDEHEPQNPSQDEDAWPTSIPSDMAIFSTDDSAHDVDRKRKADDKGSEPIPKKRRRSGAEPEHPVPFPSLGPLEMFEYEFQLTAPSLPQVFDPVPEIPDFSAFADVFNEPVASIGFPISCVRPVEQPDENDLAFGTERTSPTLPVLGLDQRPDASQVLPSASTSSAAMPPTPPPNSATPSINYDASGATLLTATAHGHSTPASFISTIGSFVSSADNTEYDARARRPESATLEFVYPEESDPFVEFYASVASSQPSAHEPAFSPPIVHVPTPQRAYAPSLSTLESSLNVLTDPHGQPIYTSPVEGQQQHASVPTYEVPAVAQSSQPDVPFFPTPAQIVQQQYSLYSVGQGPSTPAQPTRIVVNGRSVYACHLCERTFDMANGLSLHIRWHRKQCEQAYRPPAVVHPRRRALTMPSSVQQPLFVLPTEASSPPSLLGGYILNFTAKQGAVQPQYVVVSAIVDGKPVPVLAPLATSPSFVQQAGMQQAHISYA